MKKTAIALALMAAAGLAGAANLDKKDAKFLENAAGGGMFEVQAGQLAQQRSQDAQVKSFGQMLVTDHTAANEELKNLASQKGVSIPAALPKKEQKTMDKLDKSKNFDKDFVKVGVEDHKHDIKDFEKAARDAKDPDVKAFAAKTLPTLQKHLQAAEELQKAEKQASK